MSFYYAKLPLSVFVKAVNGNDASITLFELTPAWLTATAKYMCTSNEQVLLHVLIAVNNDTKAKTLIAWPLLHKETPYLKSINSLTSFYSSVTSPIVFQDVVANDLNDLVDVELLAGFESCDGENMATPLGYFSMLFSAIKQNNAWQKMLLGPIEESFAEMIAKQSRNHQTYAIAENWYSANIEDFQHYDSQRPSQLKNTIKRKEKKLAKAHAYELKLVSETADFEQYFSDYKRVYQLSWKGEEASYDFIKQVCIDACNQNKMRMGLLLIDGQVAAVQLWFLQSSTASIFKLAYDPAYASFSVGSILSMFLTKHVIDDDKVTCIEFGMGNETYKQDWMDKKRQRATMQIYNERSFTGALLALYNKLGVKVKRLLTKTDEGK